MIFGLGQRISQTTDQVYHQRIRKAAASSDRKRSTWQLYIHIYTLSIHAQSSSFKDAEIFSLLGWKGCQRRHL